MGTRSTTRLLAGLLLVYCAAVVVKLSWHTNAGQWDFSTYYCAGTAARAGLNPYDRAATKDDPQYRLWRFDFVYLPATLPLFSLLSCLPYPAAYYAFLYTKVAALAGLLVLWRREFVRGEADMLFYLLCLLGFGSTIYLDVIAGNVSVFEQLGIWLAFAAFLRGRLITFSVLIAAAASFKVVPILFLCLIWFAARPLRVRAAHFFGACVLFALVHGLAFVVKPGLTWGFVLKASSERLVELGEANPATWALVKDLFLFFEDNQIFAAPIAVQALVYAAGAAAILWVSYPAMRTLERTGDARGMLYMSCFAYTLVVPRMKDYSYALLIVPAYWIIKRMGKESAYPLLAVVLMFSPTRAELPGFDGVMEALVWPYYTLVLAYVLWALALAWVERLSSSA